VRRIKKNILGVSNLASRLSVISVPTATLTLYFLFIFYIQLTLYFFKVGPIVSVTKQEQQEAQLMLTNPRDAFRGQSRSPNIVPFHMLVIFSSCSIATLYLRRAVFLIFDFTKCRDLEIRIRGHSRSLKVVP